MNRIESCKKIEVIELRLVIGAGVESDPIRSVTQYYDMDGIRLATNDNWIESITSTDGHGGEL